MKVKIPVHILSIKLNGCFEISFKVLPLKKKKEKEKKRNYGFSKTVSKRFESI